MSNPNNRNLPEELERALRRATGRTLNALTSLRRAVREHVHQQRAAGNSLNEIQQQLRASAARALDGVPSAGNTDTDPSVLTSQIIEWAAGFYTEKQQPK
jgi:predicted RNA-binding Zn ribbon-like protein